MVEVAAAASMSTVGAYRLPHATPQQIDTLIAFARSQVGGSYNYRGALRLGLRLILGRWPRGRAGDTTPNMVLALGGYELLQLV